MVRTYRYDPKKKRMVLISTSARRTSVGFIMGAAAPNINERLAAGYKHLENTGQLNGKGNYLSTKAIKRALETPAC